jgi:hypothetical protein
MPHQPYFVVVLAHSLHGRLRRIHIPHKAVYAAFIFALFGCLFVFGFLSSYLRMAMKVAHYNTLRHEVDSLRVKYQNCRPSPTRRTSSSHFGSLRRRGFGRLRS